MIHPLIEIVDLEPDGFGHLTRIIGSRSQPVDELQVLHRGGRVIAAVHSLQGHIDQRELRLDGGRITEPTVAASTLHQRGFAARVTVIDIDGITHLTGRINDLARQTLSQTELLALTTAAWWADPSVVTVPPAPQVTWPLVERWVRAQPGSWWAAFAGWGNDTLAFSVLAHVDDGLVDQLTSFQALNASDAGLDGGCSPRRILDAVAALGRGPVRIALLGPAHEIEAALAAPEPLAHLLARLTEEGIEPELFALGVRDAVSTMLAKTTDPGQTATMGADHL